MVSVFFGAIAVAVTAVSARMIAKRAKQKRRLGACREISIAAKNRQVP